MSEYRRLYQMGSTYFFTLVTYDRKHILCDEESIKRLRRSFNYAMHKHPFRIEGIVILPDHLHCILKLPENSADFSIRLNMIKYYFSIGLKGISNKRREKNIWQKRFWEHWIRDEIDFAKHLDYLHYNPVKHGYALRPMDWPYSSFQRAVINGIYPEDWGYSQEPMKIRHMNPE